MEDNTLIGQEIEFSKTPPEAKSRGYDLTGKRGKIISDAGYGIVRVSVPGIPESITADLFRDTRRE